jgi:uncharacterized protein
LNIYNDVHTKSNGIQGVKFEWDPVKAAANVVKHGVSFTLAMEVWDDPLHVIFPDRTVDGEERWHAMGNVGALKLLVVVHSYRTDEGEEMIRIIGARSATRYERHRYEDEP